MVHSLLAAVLGTVLGTVLGVATLFYTGVGGGGTVDMLVTVLTTAGAGSLTAAPLGVFTGVTGGLIGGLVGVCFVLLPTPGWLFLHVPLGYLGAKILVAGIIASLLPLLAPH